MTDDHFYLVPARDWKTHTRKGGHLRHPLPWTLVSLLSATWNSNRPIYEITTLKRTIKQRNPKIPLQPRKTWIISGPMSTESCKTNEFKTWIFLADLFIFHQTYTYITKQSQMSNSSFSLHVLQYNRFYLLKTSYNVYYNV